MKKSGIALVFGALLISTAAFAALDQGNGFRDTFFTLDTGRWYVSNGWSNGEHQSCEWRADALSIKDNKLVLTVSDRGGKVRPIGCAEMHTNERLGYGLYETRMKTAAGSGLNTAFFTYTGKTYGTKHDEIDFEFLGKNPSKVEINHTAGDTIVHGKIVDLGFDSSKDFHDYAFDWSKDGIKWFVDGIKVYETPSGVPIPLNPSYLFVSLWTGGAIEDSWMGPFKYQQPITAEVAWVRFTPHQ